MKVLVCGGRNYNDKEEFFYQLTHTFEGWKTCEIISGMAKGADSLAVDFAKTYGLVLHKFPADWNKFGKAAGMIRNKQMLDEGQPDLVIAFPGGVGTKGMIKLALNKGVKVIEIGEK